MGNSDVNRGSGHTGNPWHAVDFALAREGNDDFR